MLSSLKAKLYTLVFLVALPGVITLTHNALNEREQVIERQKKQAINTARRLVATQKIIIQDTYHYLKHLSSVPEVQAPSHPACGAFLANILHLNTAYMNIGVPGVDGELICNALPLNRSVNVFDRAYFQYSLTQKSFAIGTYQRDRVTQKTSVNFSYPVFDNVNNVLGVAVAVVSLDWWSQQLSEYQLPEGSIAFISDEKSRVVANFPMDTSLHGRSTAHYKVNIPPELKYISATEIILGPDNISRIFTHQTLYQKDNGNNVTVSVGIPITPALAQANTDFITNLSVFALFLGLVTIFALKRLNISVLRPLTQLTNAIGKLEKGNFPKGIHMGGSEEFSILGHHFEQMANARLAAEEASNKRSHELDSIFNALPDLYFKLDNKGIILDYRTSSPEDLYVTPERFLGKTMSDILPSDVADLFVQKLASSLKGKTLSTWEYSLVMQGGIRFFEARANTIKHSNDVIIVIRNITIRKQNEQSLQLAASVFENSSECMTVTDIDGYVIDVNPAFTRVSGYERDEIIGQKTNKLASGQHDQSFYQALWSALKEQGRWEGEIYNKRKNGEIFPEWLSINSIYDKQNDTTLYVALYRDISEQKRAAELIWQQNHFDRLTNLPNRNSLIDHLDLEIKKAQYNQHTIAVLSLDLDQFKHINDTLGHDQGDALLKEVSKKLLSITREEDMIARQGGDEFIIVLSDLPDTGPAIRLADEIFTMLSSSIDINSEPVHVSASIGISFYPQDGKNTEELLKTSDQSMYAAKDAGRNRFHCFTQAMQDAVVQRMQLIKDLRVGIQDNQFQLMFQPIVTLATGELNKAEALIRWNHPINGTVSPVTFIPVAEDTRLITPIGNWVFDEGCRSIRALQNTFGENFQLSINVSPAQFSDNNSNLLQWISQLRQLGIKNTSIVLEITEGLLMNSSEESLSTLLNFRDAGIQVALDDFGTGYSSLSYIQEYDIDYLKIDREFVKNLPESQDSYVLCESIIVMAHKLGIKVIAEGIETEEQRQTLQRMGCDYGQGYLFSRPIPLGEFIQLSGIMPDYL